MFIVEGTTGIVAQYLIGMSNVLKLGMGVRIVGIFIRMTLACNLHDKM